MERYAQVGPIKLCYETFGNPEDPALLLIMGLGTQMVAWRDDFCAQLAGEGLYVIRFDNRDNGRSTFVKGRLPSPVELLLRKPRNPAYTLDEMADDAAGLLDALGIRAAHIVGASMGGMIAQMVAVRHPEKVLSLASIMSRTGSRFAGNPSYRLWSIFLRTAPKDREAYSDHVVRLMDVIGSPGFERSEEDIRALAVRSFDRNHRRDGTGRQLAAILASGDRTEQLRGITAPTVVIHGTADKLVAPSGGRATCKAIPGSRLVEINGMGHDLPRGAWDRIIGAIVSNAERAETRAPIAA
jgi:pimeloyl-ACP methyl ester carboxylesterase